jgi:hypothetical protein
MLESAIAITDGQAQKIVVLEWRRSAEEIDLGFTQSSQVSRNSLKISLATPSDDKRVRHATGNKIDALELAHFNGMVNELVVVRSCILAETPRIHTDGKHCSRNSPAIELSRGWRLYLQSNRFAFAPSWQDEHTGPIEVTPPHIQKRTPNRLVERIYRNDEYEFPACTTAAPSVLVDLFYGDGAAIAVRADCDDMARKLPQQIAARDPRRQRELFAIPRVGQTAFDLEVVLMNVGRANAICDQGSIQYKCVPARHFLTPPGAMTCRSACKCGIALLSLRVAVPRRAKRECSRSCRCPRNCRRLGLAA